MVIALRGEWKRTLLWTSAGIAAPLLIVFLWLWNGGALGDAWVAVVDYNRAYVGVGATLWQFADRFVHEVWRLTKTDPLWLLGMSSLAVAAIGWRIERRLDWAMVAGWLWLTASIVAAAANGTRVYSTYFQQCLPPLALLAGLLAAGPNPASARARWRHVALAAVLLIGAWRVQKAGVIERVSTAMTADTGQWRAAPEDRQSRLEYLGRFGSYASGRGFSARANAELTEYLLGHRPISADHANGQRIYIFGMAPGVLHVGIDAGPAFSVDRAGGIEPAPQSVVYARHGGGGPGTDAARIHHPGTKQPGFAARMARGRAIYRARDAAGAGTVRSGRRDRGLRPLSPAMTSGNGGASAI